MAKTKVPRFESLKEERQYWDTHDAFKVLGDEGWEVVEAGTTQVISIYVTRVGKKGAMVHLPKPLLEQIGAKRRVRVWTEGKRLIVEAV